MGFGEEGKKFPQNFFPSSPITNQPLLGTELQKKELPQTFRLAAALKIKLLTGSIRYPERSLLQQPCGNRQCLDLQHN